MIYARAHPLLKVAVRMVPKNAQNSYICTFEYTNVDSSNTVALSCDFKLMKCVPSAR